MLSCISVYHIFSSTAEDDAPVDPLYVVGNVLLGVEGIFTQATWKCPFPNILCSIVLVQLLP